MSNDGKKHTGIPGENGWDEKPSADQLGIAADTDTAHGIVSSVYLGSDPEQDEHRANRTVTIVDTEVRGLSYAVAATGGSGLEVQTIDWREADPDRRPDRVVGTRVVSSIESFFHELERKPLTAESTLWANAQSNAVEVVYDDHTGTEDGGRANYRADRLQLSLKVDEEWKQWHAISGQYMSQEEFGDAIEELIHTVVEPDQADLMEVIESIRVTTGSVFESGIRRSDGQQNLSFKEESTATAGRQGQLEIPQTIAFAVRRYEGFPQRYEIRAWFRTRIVNGSLKLAVKLKPTRPTEIAAWEDITKTIADEKQRPVLLTG